MAYHIKKKAKAEDEKKGLGVNWQTSCSGIGHRASLLLQAQQWTDCEFAVGSTGERIQGHRLLLAMASPVFAAMFYGPLAETKYPIVIPDVEPEVFKEMLRYTATDQAHITSVVFACELHYTAKKYMLPHLAALCAYCLWKHVEPRTACFLLEYATLVNEESLLRRCIQVIQEQTSQVLRSKTLEDASMATMELIFSMEPLGIDSELELFKAAEKYARAQNFKNRQPSQIIDITEDKQPTPIRTPVICQKPDIWRSRADSPDEIDSKDPAPQTSPSPKTSNSEAKVSEQNSKTEPIQTTKDTKSDQSSNITKEQNPIDLSVKTTKESNFRDTSSLKTKEKPSKDQFLNNFEIKESSTNLDETDKNRAKGAHKTSKGKRFATNSKNKNEMHSIVPKKRKINSDSGLEHKAGLSQETQAFNFEFTEIKADVNDLKILDNISPSILTTDLLMDMLESSQLPMMLSPEHDASQNHSSIYSNPQPSTSRENFVEFRANLETKTETRDFDPQPSTSSNSESESKIKRDNNLQFNKPDQESEPNTSGNESFDVKTVRQKKEVQENRPQDTNQLKNLFYLTSDEDSQPDIPNYLKSESSISREPKNEKDSSIVYNYSSRRGSDTDDGSQSSHLSPQPSTSRNLGTQLSQLKPKEEPNETFNNLEPHSNITKDHQNTNEILNPHKASKYLKPKRLRDFESKASTSKDAVSSTKVIDLDDESGDDIVFTEETTKPIEKPKKKERRVLWIGGCKQESPIRKLVHLIRFLTMTPQEFSECTSLCSLLSGGEIYSLLMNICSQYTPVPMPKGFSCSRVQRTKFQRHLTTAHISTALMQQDKNRTEASHLVTINSFSGLKSFYSAPFYVVGLPWRLVVKPEYVHVNANHTAKYLSVFVECNWECSSQWQVRVTTQLHLLREAGRVAPRFCTFSATFSRERTVRGHSTFALLDDIYSEGYVWHDAITILVTITRQSDPLLRCCTPIESRSNQNEEALNLADLFL